MYQTLKGCSSAGPNTGAAALNVMHSVWARAVLPRPGRASVALQIRECSASRTAMRGG